MLTITTERFEARLATVASELRQDMARMDSGVRIALTDGLSKIRLDMSDARIEIMRWSFFFWLGHSRRPSRSSRCCCALRAVEPR